MMEGTAAPADFCFVHFTDTPIMAGRIPGKLDTSASLQRVIEVLTALEPRPAFAIIGGDLVSPDLLDRNRTSCRAPVGSRPHLVIQNITDDVRCLFDLGAIDIEMGDEAHAVLIHR